MVWRSDCGGGVEVELGLGDGDRSVGMSTV